MLESIVFGILFYAVRHFTISFRELFNFLELVRLNLVGLHVFLKSIYIY